MSRGVIIRNVEGLILPLSLLSASDRDVQILQSKKIAVIPDELIDDVAAAIRALFDADAQTTEAVVRSLVESILAEKEGTV